MWKIIWITHDLERNKVADPTLAHLVRDLGIRLLEGRALSGEASMGC